MPLATLSILLNRSRRPHRATPSSTAHLPLEVWDLVLEELGDDSLRIAARVCSAFNDRAIAIQLERNGISSQSIGSGVLHLHSHLLHILQLSRVIPPIHTLVCRFWVFRVFRDMKFLRHFIQRSQEITELHLSFSYSLFHVHRLETLFPYSQHALLTEFCGVLRAMASKTVGPVIVIANSQVYRVRRCDLAIWGLRYLIQFQWRPFGAHWIDWTLFALGRDFTRPYLLLLAPRRGLMRRFKYMWELRSINIRVVPAVSEATEPFTLVAFDSDIESTVGFGTSGHRGDIPGSHLTTIIPHITLPALQELRITQDVDPTALTEFLDRHPTIRRILYEIDSAVDVGDPGAERSDGSLKRRLLTSTPIALPSLESLRCNDAGHILPLLDTFGLSPHLFSLRLSFKHHSPAHLTGLKRGLRRLSLRSTPLRLDIGAWGVAENPWQPIDDAGRQIVGCLWCVDHVRISGRTPADLQLLILWLGMLPALLRLELVIFSLNPPDGHHDYDALRSAALQEAQMALPRVPQIVILP
ncbi:hypothetical protein DFH09DRAFT_1164623 [Mycena vulgaris]|nr:hypothetical protein DFH09DRAFT_1164623 [Mycena vulgaris]